jgi:hypothetical protein
MTTREKAHKLLDELPDSEIEPVVEFIASRGTVSQQGDSFARWLDSRPEEDEEITAEEEAAVQEARDEIAAGAPLLSLDEIKREFGYDSK